MGWFGSDVLPDGVRDGALLWGGVGETGKGWGRVRSDPWVGPLLHVTET